MTASSDRAAWDGWRAARHDALTAPEGNLALVETRWLGPGETPDLDAARDGLAPSVRVTTLTRENIDTGAPEHGLRFWDADSPAIRQFAGVDSFAYDPDWVIPARYERAPDGHTVAFEHLRDNGGTREKAVPGTIHASIAGREYALSAFDDDGRLLLVFGDPTNGSATYGAGRFLFVDDPAGGAVTLDFNRAFVPPCGFSDQYNCPMPPLQNRLAVPVTAGEKTPRFRD
ncbi:DUF1684 domain-containing protein [Microbacterium excoecariae]|uniref:DUF1684 domain-containing protein n=1 Tax=Microbacterium excoecariae TaxID=2715210 RepID=UPI0014089F91|nr:DUF1684 domain-containing protein [Microbacterium excoecariae]NHI17432.1 DUF1684 domain-containing protein [Microbacterium excoecariae]